MSFCTVFSPFDNNDFLFHLFILLRPLRLGPLFPTISPTVLTWDWDPPLPSSRQGHTSPISDSFLAFDLHFGTSLLSFGPHQVC